MEHLKELRRDCAIKQKKGLHFILASIFIWSAVLVIHLLYINIAAKNLYTFCATATLLPIAFGFSKLDWGRFPEQDESAHQSRHNLFMQPNTLSAHRYVGDDRYASDDGHGACYHFRCTSYAFRLALLF